jgi:hypothetical protein
MSYKDNLTKAEACGHLTGRPREIAEAIFDLAVGIGRDPEEQGEPTLYTGGCKPFYTSEEWLARDELYGTDSELVVVYDGGDLYEFFGTYAMFPSWYEKMSQALEKVGSYREACTGWYSAVYPV